MQRLNSFASVLTNFINDQTHIIESDWIKILLFYLQLLGSIYKIAAPYTLIDIQTFTQL